MTTSHFLQLIQHCVSNRDINELQIIQRELLLCNLDLSLNRNDTKRDVWIDFVLALEFRTLENFLKRQESTEIQNNDD